MKKYLKDLILLFHFLFEFILFEGILFVLLFFKCQAASSHLNFIQSLSSISFKIRIHGHEC